MKSLLSIYLCIIVFVVFLCAIAAGCQPKSCSTMEEHYKHNPSSRPKAKVFTKPKQNRNHKLIHAKRETLVVYFCPHGTETHLVSTLNN